MKKTILLTILLVITAAAFAQNLDLQPAATIRLTREEPITVRQLRVEVERLEQAESRKFTSAERKEILDAMVNERLVMQAAARDRVTITDAEVNQQIQQLQAILAQQLGRPPTEAEFEQAVRNEFSMEYSAFREQLRKQLLVQKYLLQTKQSLISTLKVPTEQEIRDNYALVRAQLVRPETVRFTMIMVPYGNDAASRANARNIANGLYNEIAGDPDKFDSVAGRVNPSSNYQAGDVGFIPRTPEARAAMGQQLLDAAFSLRQSQVSGVLEGPQGYCIIKVTQRHPQQQLELDDVMQLGTSTTVRQFIGQSMLQERQAAILKQASDELIAELRSAGTVRINEQNLNW